MRKRFVSTLVDLADSDERIVLLTADLGFMVLEEFGDIYPERFINVGVAEANMVSMAAGLAQRGLVPYCYSIATFASMRGYEQLRDGAAAHRLRIRIVGVGGGFAYGSAGFTHHALEDIALMRVQPSVNVIAPADDAQTETAIRATANLDLPVYFRLSKDSHSIPELEGRFDVGKLQILREGEVLIVVTGSLTDTALEAANSLSAQDISCAVAVVACISPPPTQQLAELLNGRNLCVTIEDHRPNGGLGSLVAEVIAEFATGTKLVRKAVTDEPGATTGSEKFLLSRNGLDLPGIVNTVRTQYENLS